MIDRYTTQIVLDYFYVHPTEAIHLRELSRKLSISMPSVVQAMKKLEKEKLVFVERGIALTQIRALHGNEFLRLKRVYNLDSLYRCGLVDYLIESLRPVAIVCFGSYSRGEDTEKSDIDIAVICGKDKEIDITKFEKRLCRKISIHHVDMKRVSSEFKSNLANGIVLEGVL